ncbi:MAG: phosphate starvation-inducible protein PhoH, partial [Alphaproteobacteria bacterium]|nr:phosphate starvation-inducible protein PhoH [Alphaproteobacteria bacterium]
MNTILAARHPSPSGPPSSESRSVTLQFDDNALLAQLFGEFDRHLSLLEKQAGVRLSSRGNRLTISGNAERTQVAEEALRS